MLMKTFYKVSFFMVVLPAIAALLAYGEYWITGKTGALSLVLFLPLSFYYYLPTILFGEPLFIGGIGAGPTGLGGLLVGGLFYSLVSLFITILYCTAKNTKIPNGDQ